MSYDPLKVALTEYKLCQQKLKAWEDVILAHGGKVPASPGTVLDAAPALQKQDSEMKKLPSRLRH